MVLHIVDVPNPPAGSDWVHTVPGKYLYNVTGVIGRLTTANIFPPLVDSSGNGLNLAIALVLGQDPNQIYGFPGAIPGDTAIRNYVAPGGRTGFAHATGMTPMTYAGDWSVECWVKAAGGTNGVGAYLAGGPGGISQAASIQSDGTMRIIRGFPDQYHTAAGAGLFDDQWHHYVWSFPFAGAVTFWRDGVQQPTTVTTPVGSRTAGFGTNHSGAFPFGSYTAPISQDELAVYSHALTGAQVAAHYAARGNFATYSAAVLADTPAQYYHLDEANPAGGRQVTFLVTDGALATLHTPTGFPTDPTGFGATYSWQPQLQASSEDVTGHAFAVPLPALVLPAGYTLGSYTLDLQPTDQWSGVKIWWDDAYQTAQQAADSYLYAPGAHLVYQQTKVG